MPETVALERHQPAEGARRYVPYGAARQLWYAKHREVLLAGPAGTGKSRACLEKLNAAAMQRPIRAAIVRKVRRSITQSAMVTFETKVLPSPTSVRFHHEDQEYRYPTGARIIVGGLDDPEKIKSTEFDLIYVQEATELTEVDWGMLLSRLRNGVLSYHQLMADCNPGPPDHWLKKRADSGATLMLESRHEDNPTLSEEYIATLDALMGPDPEHPSYLYQRLRLGLWVAAEGMYFTEWNPERHTCKAFDPPDHWPRWTSTDWGFAVPWAVYWYARSPEDDGIYVYREVYATGMRDQEQADIIRQRSEGERVVLHVGDPSMFNKRTESQRPSVASIYWQRGVKLYPGTNNRIAGWQAVRNVLAGDLPRLQVMRERCPNLIRTLPEMVRDPLDPEDVADKVNGAATEDHAADSLRYGIMAEAQPPTPGKRLAVFG
jgi:PBSX family phage terminase large subunit